MKKMKKYFMDLLEHRDSPEDCTMKQQREIIDKEDDESVSLRF